MDRVRIPRDKATDRSKGLREGAHDEVSRARQLEVMLRTLAFGAQHAQGVRVVDVDAAVVLLGQFGTLFGLVPISRRPLHVGNLALRSQNLFRVAMAFETPLHLQRLCVPHQRHFVYLPVTCRTSDAFVDVYAVVEVGEIREVMHSRPFDRPAGAPAVAHNFQVGTIGK